MAGRGGVSERTADRFSGAPERPCRDESNESERQLEEEPDEERGLGHGGQRQVARGDEALEVLLEHEAERRQERERPGGRLRGRSASTRPDGMRSKPDERDRKRGSEQERRRCQVAVTGPGQQIATRGAVGLDDPVGERVRRQRAGRHQRHGNEPRERAPIHRTDDARTCPRDGSGKLPVVLP